MKAAKRFTARRAFYSGESGAYTAAWKNGWLEEICAHMETATRKPPGFWNDLEACRKEARRYKTRTAFHNESGGAYTACFKNGWLDDVCSHMRPQGNRARRAVYVIVDPVGKKAYVGLSGNPHRRYAEHRANGKPWVQGLLDQPHKFLVTPFMSAEAAALKEKKLILKYASRGYHVVNRVAGGSLGGSRRRWTKELCLEAASTFTSVAGFRKGSPRAYAAAAMYGWLEEICSDLEPSKPRRSNGYWTKQACHAEALRYAHRTAFARGSGSAYAAAYGNGWLDEICEHMEAMVNPKGTWTRKAVGDAAASCKTRTEFNTEYPAAYGAAKRNGWFEDVCKHMPKRSTATKRDPDHL